MSRNRVILIAGVGCLLLILLLIIAIPAGLFALTRVSRVESGVSPGAVVTKVVEAVPVTPMAQDDRSQQPTPPAESPGQLAGPAPGDLTTLYEQVNPGVVSIRVQVTRGVLTGQSAGSGFILDAAGHIVTNNHVVADARRVAVVFYDGTEVEGEVVGTDADSDLAVIQVDELPTGTRPLPVGDSDLVTPGQWVVAVGNPFEFAGSMTIGIVSAIGRAIPSLTPQFSIPQAIQTDAAINPGNSGGPLLNLKGEVVGVNDQIRTADGVRANAGVGFAIPSNIVSLVAPSLIEKGSYTWPWLGVSGPLQGVDMAIQQANDLETQQGAYVHEVIAGGPAEKAGLQGSRAQDEPVGGDVIIEADGKPIRDFSDLLISVAFKQPGDTIELTILRDGQKRQVTATLDPRPANVTP